MLPTGGTARGGDARSREASRASMFTALCARELQPTRSARPRNAACAAF
jgi:hypothetical protein